jgi:hypothetical protein
MYSQSPQQSSRANKRHSPSQNFNTPLIVAVTGAVMAVAVMGVGLFVSRQEQIATQSEGTELLKAKLEMAQSRDKYIEVLTRTDRGQITKTGEIIVKNPGLHQQLLLLHSQELRNRLIQQTGNENHPAFNQNLSIAYELARLNANNKLSRGSLIKSGVAGYLETKDASGKWVKEPITGTGLMLFANNTLLSLDAGENLPVIPNYNHSVIFSTEVREQEAYRLGIAAVLAQMGLIREADMVRDIKTYLETIQDRRQQALASEKQKLTAKPNPKAPPSLKKHADTTDDRN